VFEVDDFDNYINVKHDENEISNTIKFGGANVKYMNYILLFNINCGIKLV